MAREFLYNRDDIEETSYQVLPAGTYSAKVIEAEEATSEGSGRDIVKMKYDVYADSGLEPHNPDYGQGTTVQINDVLLLEILETDKNPKTVLYKTKQFFNALELWDEKGNAMVDPATWIGCYVKVKVNVKPNTYINKDGNEVTVERNGVNQISPIGDSEAAELEKQYGPF